MDWVHVGLACSQGIGGADERRGIDGTDGSNRTHGTNGTDVDHGAGMSADESAAASAVGKMADGVVDRVPGGAGDSEIEMGEFLARPGATEKNVRDLRACFVGLRRMSKGGFAPTRKVLLREIGLPDTAFKVFFERYTDLVKYCGLRPAGEKRGASARERRAKLRGRIGDEVAKEVGEAAEKEARLTRNLTWNGAGKIGEQKESVFGDPIEGYQLKHAPVNEQGVVVLFALMAKELDFVIDVVRQGFPDCEAKRKGLDGKWRRVRIEFEYLTSRFDHDPAGCDLIVCWEDDVKRNFGVEVMELKKEMGKARERGEN